MSDTEDLRPAPSGGYKPKPVAPISRKWWQPLASKWGILGLLIFLGLAISVAENTIGRLFNSGERSDRSRQPYSDYRDRASLDAKATGDLLIKVLSSLPGDNPEDNFHLAHTLAYEYGYKWQQENEALDAKRSDIAKQELKKSQNEQWQRLEQIVEGQLRASKPNNQVMIAALQDSLGKAGAGAIHYYGQKINDHIEREASKVAQIPALANEITALLTEWEPAPAERRAEIKKKISDRLEAYAAATDAKRRLPSTKSDDLDMAKQKEARAHLRQIAGLPYTPAVKIIIQNLADAADEDIRDAVYVILR